MVQFNTGNAQWDQGLSSLGNALFPDPSKVAQAGYYGAEARKAQLQGNQLIDQGNAQNLLWNMLHGNTAAPQIQTPQNVPGAPPILAPQSSMAPPSTIGGTVPLSSVYTMTTKGTPPAQSPPVPGAPPAPNTTGSDGSVPANQEGAGPIHPGTVMPPDGGQKYAAPAAANGAPAPLAIRPSDIVAMGVRAGMNAQQVQSQLGAYIGDLWTKGMISKPVHDVLQADMGNTGALTSATTVQTTGMQQSGETTREGMRLREDYAKHLGTPLTAQGVDANNQPTMLFPPVTSNEFAPAGSAAPAAAPQAQPQPGAQPQPQPGAAPPLSSAIVPGQPGAPAQPSPAASMQPRQGPPVFNQQLAEQQRGLIQVVDKNGQRTAVPYSRFVQGGYTPVNPADADKPVTVYAQTPDGKIDPRRTESVPLYQAQRDRRQIVPTTTEEVKAQAGLGQIIAPQDTALPGDVSAALTSTQTPTQVDANESARRQTLTNQAASVAYPPPPQNQATGNMGVRTNAAIFSPAANAAVQQLANQLMVSSPDRGVRGNYGAALSQAISTLQQQGRLPKQLDRTTGLWGGGRGIVTHTDPTTGESQDYVEVDLLPQPLSQTVAPQPGQAPVATPPAPTAPAPAAVPPVPPAPAAPSPARPQGAPAGAIGRAPPGRPDGPIQTPSGARGMVRGGWVFPVQ